MLVTGKAYWAKITGNPVANKYNPAVPQWVFDLSISDEEANNLISKGMKSTYIKDKGDERGKFVSFVRESVKKDLTPGKPFSIIDAHGEKWPHGKEIGNGSTLNVMVTLNERTYRNEKFLKPAAIAIQVWDLVEFDRGKSFPTRPGQIQNASDVSSSEGEGEDVAYSTPPKGKSNKSLPKDW